MFTVNVVHAVVVKLTAVGDCRHLPCPELAVNFQKGKNSVISQVFNLRTLILILKSSHDDFRTMKQSRFAQSV